MPSDMCKQWNKANAVHGAKMLTLGSVFGSDWGSFGASTSTAKDPDITTAENLEIRH